MGTIKVAERYFFSGPFENTHDLAHQSGVYVVLAPAGGNSWNVVDVGKSGNVRNRIETHSRKECWRQYGGKYIAVFYTDARNCDTVEDTVRRIENPPCGDE